MMSPMSEVPLSSGGGNGHGTTASSLQGGKKWYEADPHQRGVAGNMAEAAEKDAKRKTRFRILLGVGAACFWCGCVASLGALFGWLWCLLPLLATATFLFLRQKGILSNNVAVALAGASAVVPLVTLPVLFYVVGFDLSEWMEAGIPDGPMFEDVLYRTCASAPEGAYAEFTCPAGSRIENVIFASYGRPSVCKAWRQTGGCNPDGPREKSGDLGCETKIDSQRSGFCECSGGRRAGMVGCGHNEFTCAEACAAPVTCSMWRQTGGCNPDGPREPAGDKECSAVVPSSASGYCECGGGVIVRKVECDHVPFTCRDECARYTGGCVPHAPDHNCHEATSETKFIEMCKGKKRCSIWVGSGTFGDDPCPQFNDKSFYAEVACRGRAVLKQPKLSKAELFETECKPKRALFESCFANHPARVQMCERLFGALVKCHREHGPQ